MLSGSGEAGETSRLTTVALSGGNIASPLVDFVGLGTKTVTVTAVVTTTIAGEADEASIDDEVWDVLESGNGVNDAVGLDVRVELLVDVVELLINVAELVDAAALTDTAVLGNADGDAIVLKAAVEALMEEEPTESGIDDTTGVNGPSRLVVGDSKGRRLLETGASIVPVDVRVLTTVVPGRIDVMTTVVG